MSFKDRFRETLYNLRDEDEGVDVIEEAAEPYEDNRYAYTDYYEEEDVKRITPDAVYDIILAHPKSVDDAPDIVGNLRVNHVCIINLEGVDINIAQRIADFLGGASFAMNGSIERINENIFVMAPLGVSIKDMLKKSGDKSGSLFSWVTKAARF